ncbi:MAG: epoxyqueuosine reductase QueH [Negativicutes bacterium]|nr:epoxyqueuosine reductase QueH [Negativicutes bacterium]
MRLLLHVCCGPCAAYPVAALKAVGHELTGFFYNPNIHPYEEFAKRLETSREFAAKAGIELIVDATYALEDFLSGAMQDLSKRCEYCYSIRLRKAAIMARENNYEAFSTTLLVSPYQKHEMIRGIGEQVAKAEQIPFFYVDFREGWNEGVRMSKEWELYRQPYCGCIFSEKERYYRVRKEKSTC